MSPRFVNLKRIFRSSNNNKKSALLHQKEGRKEDDHNSDDSTANQTLEPSSPITTATTTTNSTEEKPKKENRKKSVRFPSVVKLEHTRQISRLSSRSLEEVKAMWEDEEEEKQRKDNLKKDLKKALCSCQEEEEGEEAEEDSTEKENKNEGSPKQQKQKQKLVDCSDVTLNDSILNDSSSQFTALGLQDKVGPGLQEKRQHRENAWDAVMWEQHYQYEEGRKECDYDLVARVYEEQANTTQLQSKAHVEAQRLYEELMKEQANDDDEEYLELMSLSGSSTHSRREL